MLEEDDCRQLVVVAHPLEFVFELLGLLTDFEGVGRGTRLGLRKRRPADTVGDVANGITHSLPNHDTTFDHILIEFTVSLLLWTQSES